MGTRKGKKRTALTPPPDSRSQPVQPGGSTDTTQPPTPAGPRTDRTESNSESGSSYGGTDLSILNSPTNSDNISLFPNISGAMSDSVTRFTVEHSEKERMVQLQVSDIKAKTKHIEKLIKENHPDWLVIKKCSQLKDIVDSFENLSKDLITKSNQMNISLQLSIHDPKTDETKVTRCKQLSEVLLKFVTKQSELETMIEELTCSFIAKIPDTSGTQPDTVAAPTLLQANSTIYGSFDYLRPPPLSSDCSPDTQSFRTWFGMICGGQEQVNRDKAFMFASLSQSLDTEWQTFIRQKPEVDTMTLDQIFQLLEDQMLISKPMSVRRSEFIKIKQDEAENAPSFLRRVMAKARAADIRNMTAEEHILLMFAMNLSKTDISNTIRTSVFDYLQKKQINRQSELSDFKCGTNTIKFHLNTKSNFKLEQ